MPQGMAEHMMLLNAIGSGIVRMVTVRQLQFVQANFLPRLLRMTGKIMCVRADNVVQHQRIGRLVTPAGRV